MLRVLGGSTQASWQLITVGDVAYFGAIVPNSAASEDRELHAYNVTNQTAWTVTDLNTNATTGAKSYGLFLLNDVLYFKARVGLDDGHSCVAHAPSNATTWIKDDGFKCPADFGTSTTKKAWIGGILYSGASAYNPDNQTSWYVINSTRTGGAGTYTYVAVGDVLYFSGSKDGAGNSRRSLWAHDTTNGTTWFVEGSNTTTTNYQTPRFIHASGTTAMFQHFVMTTPSLMVVQAAEINSLVNTGGSVTTYGINASLPSGVSFGTNNGTIYGTPTELWTQTSYMVWANNSGGSSVAYLNITVVEELAIINILPSSATITRGYDMADINANNTGGDVSSWSISPALPLGLSLDNGTIQGRPLVNMSATTFTIYANNSGGSATATLTLTINEPTPNIEYSPDNHTLTNGTTYTITPTLLGQTGDISSILGGGTVSASGACTYGNLLIYQTNDYRVWAFNTSLSTSTSNPYVLATGVSFSNSCSGRFVYNGTMYFQASTNSTGAELWKTDGTTAGTSMVKDISSGTTSSYPSAFFVYNEELHFQIKMGTNGIDIWKTNGTSSGTVKATNTVCYNVNCRFSSPIEYNGTFYAAGYWNNQGSEVLMYDSSGLSLLVDLTPGQRFSIPRTTNPSHLTVYDGWFWFLTNGNPQTGNGNCLYRSNGTAAGTTAFVCDTGTYGLELFNGELYFSRSANGKGYELWKTDGTMSGTVMVKDIVAGGGSALGSTATNRLFTSTDDYLYFSVHTGTANTDHAVWRTDGTAAGTKLVKSSLVASTHHVVIGNVLYMRGQHFATDSDSILGLWSTDGTTNGTTMYTNYDGEFLIPNVGDLHNINGSLYLRYSNGTVYTYGQMSDAAGAIIGNPSSWSISPSLPAGLSFGTNNGTIWGTPSALSNTTQYNITATNANGTSTTTIRLTVIDVAPSVTYPTDVLNLTVNETSALLPFAPTSTGGDVTSWVIAPAGPAGLFFSSANGTIWGMPTELWNTTTYTIWANNSGGSVNVTFNLTVVDQVPTELAYADLNLSLTNNTAMVPSTPTLSGSGEITGWAIEPSLPAGLEFGTSNGTVWGTPTEILNRTEFTIWANNSGGSVNVTFNLTVEDQIPTDLTYADLNLSLTNNTAMVPSTPTLTGPGDITGWAIAPSLPAGLEFGTSNGTVWGTPTEILNRTEFTIWANNSGGSVNVTFNLTVVDQIPGMLTMADVQGRNNTAITPMTPTLTGAGTITGWSISPSLPAGLEFGTSNGSIWGTPTAILARTQFTLMASNSGGSVSTIFNLTVVDEVPDSIDLSDVDIQATNNTPLTPIEANLTGSGEITEWSIAPSLPTGVEFGTNNGTIWGTPTQLLNRTMFTVWGNNSGGSVNVTFNLTVVDQVPDELTLPSFDISATNNSMMPPVEVMTSGSGEITQWAIAPALPTGLQFGTANGTIWGTPTQLLARTTYTIWGNNTGGSVNVTFNLTVVDQIPDAIDLTDVDLRATNNTALAPVEFNITGSGAITAWAISPSLPAGLEFGTSNGTIWGTPTALLPRTEFTVWGNNTGGSVNRSFNLTVVDEVPESVNLTSEDIVVTNNTQMSPLETELEGSGEITAWSIHPSLPTGLEFNTSNGTVWGTPTELLNRTTFTIWANNSGGSVNASFNLTVIDQVPTSIDLPSIEVSGTNNTALGPLEVNLTGNGTITTWSIAPSLPTGLELGSANGTIWGTPTQLLNRTEFTLSGNNSGGSVSVRFNLTIVDEVPDSITVPTTELTATNNTAMVPVEVNVTGSGSITAWAIDPVLPNGLQFGPSNGTIWGTPTMLFDRTMFTIWGNNSGGSVHLMFNLTVLDEVPDAFDYVPSTLQATNGTAIVGLTPTFTGRGTILTWAITPSLPAGLQLDPSNGTVWGTPTELRLTPTTHTIWANTSGGSIQTTILVSVLDPELGSFSFQPSSRRVRSTPPSRRGNRSCEGRRRI